MGGRWIMPAMLAAAAGAHAATPEPALQPTGKWTLEYADNMCVASRHFGDPATGPVLGLRPYPISERAEIVIVETGKSDKYRQGKATVIIAPGQVVRDGPFTSLSTGGRRITTVTIDGYADLPRATVITVARDGEPDMSFAPMGIHRVMTALAACQDDLLRSWKVDTTVLAAVAVPAVPNRPESWIQADDYPRGAIVGNEEGTTFIVWTITKDGTVSNCRTVVSSGSTALDQASCNAVVKRGRYQPALDQQGRPVISYALRRVIWRLPTS